MIANIRDFGQLAVDYGHTASQTDRQTDRQIAGETDRQTGGQTER